MIPHKNIRQNRRTGQPIIVVAISIIFIHNWCTNADPAINWSSRSLAGFRNLFRNGGDKMSSRQPSQHRKYQSNSSFAPKPTNIRPENKRDNNQVSYNQLKNRPSSSTQISKRRLSWNSPPNILYPSTRTITGHQYNSHSRYLHLLGIVL